MTILDHRDSLIPSSSTSSSWKKLIATRQQIINQNIHSIVEREKLSIANYEFEQTRLDAHRMKVNGNLVLERLEVSSSMNECSNRFDQIEQFEY
jgi:ABC-type phosphate transport system auxiliary subunit